VDGNPPWQGRPAVRRASLKEPGEAAAGRAGGAGEASWGGRAAALGRWRGGRRGHVGGTSRCRSSIQSYNWYVARDGSARTSGSSLSAIEIMFFICVRKKRIFFGLSGVSSISL
jgi:hypothetical protein